MTDQKVNVTSTHIISRTVWVYIFYNSEVKNRHVWLQNIYMEKECYEVEVQPYFFSSIYFTLKCYMKGVTLFKIFILI